MGRPSLGDDGRTVTKSVKVSRKEVAYLTRRYGSVSNALRAGLDKLLPDSTTTPTPPARRSRVVATQETFEASCGPRLTDHPGWTEVARGAKTRTIIKACRACGHQVTERQS